MSVIRARQRPIRYQLLLAAVFIGLVLFNAAVSADEESKQDTRPGIAPDIREDESGVKVQHGNLVVVPVPMSNPTLGTGLVVGAAYFYPQTEEQKNRQPASLTAVGGLYTDNDSRAVVVAQQNYWKNDRWRFTGVAGAADLRLSLLAPGDTPGGQSVDWRVDGNFLFGKISRRLAGDWYLGLLTRMVDANQSIETDSSTRDFDTASSIRSVGLGFDLEYDSRDAPFSTYTGRLFKFGVLLNEEAIGSDSTYQSYSAAFRSYHKISDSLVLAWEIQGCQKAGSSPLWDACTVRLRGFSATDYLGKVSASGQVEARWQLSKRWGVVGFGGSGWVGNSFSGIREHEAIPSYGAGLRFMVLPAKRINLRLDYARSTDSDAIHFSVAEAF